MNLMKIRKLTKALSQKYVGEAYSNLTSRKEQNEFQDPIILSKE